MSEAGNGGGVVSDFWKGVLAGVGGAMAVVLIVFLVSAFNKQDRKIIEALVAQNEVQALLEEVLNRDPYEFLDGDAGVRRAADRGIEEFNRKRDRAIRAIRDGK